MNEAVIVSAKRTPIGSFQGQLSSLSAPELGAKAIEAALQSANLTPEQVDECIMGQVLTAGAGQAPARQAAIYAGLPKSTECLTINKVCGSGLKAVMLAQNAIQCGLADTVVAGGQESMSNAPYLIQKARAGLRMGHGQMIDSMIHDGLWDPYGNVHMGNCGELCAKEKQYSREQQDELAIESYKRAQRANAEGSFKSELVEVEVAGRKPFTCVEDEEPGRAKFEKIPELRPAFDKEGTITAANASKINDGASALVVMNSEKAKSLGLKPLAKIVSQASFAAEPEWFTTAPVGAIEKALKRADLKASDIDLWEINEAFAVVSMAAMDAFDISRDRVNVNGGAIALGHPIGCSGARILTTLLHAMDARNAKRGLATLCIGGGEGAALIVEKA